MRPPRHLGVPSTRTRLFWVEGPEIKFRPVGAGSWSIHDRFSVENLQAVIDLYISGATSSQVAQRFGISVSSVKRVLRDHGMRKRVAGSARGCAR
ncbi:MAG: helix-turn-helix domain-containing protein [Pseudonocardiales bacterium]|nr:helix-turn-helix domain-containing protein [Pseudonocardiales bacterium]